MPNESKNISRKDFIKGATAGIAGIAALGLAGCASAPASAPAAPEGGITWDQETDVVVVGSGGAGFAAAIEAAKAGASVLLLEKLPTIGGDSRICGGILGGWGTRLAKAQGINVTAEVVYDWFMGNPEWYGPKDPEIVRVLADKSGETIDWLEDLGVPFEKEVAGLFGYTELPVIHHVEGRNGAKMIEALAASAEKAGVKLQKETKATKLLSAENGRVIGIEAEQKGTSIKIKANKGVVLATGGFSASSPMLTVLNAESANIFPSSNLGATGDGLVMAMESGVFTTRISTLPHMTTMAGLETGSVNTLNYHERLHGLWLDANGERFFDEETPYENPLGHRAILRKQNKQGSKVVLLVGTTPELEEVMAANPLAWATANTVEEVAQAVGLDGGKVKATVDRFNGFCATGKDEDFRRDPKLLIPLKAPFYAATITVSTAVTLGGIKTNTKAQALRLNLADGKEMTEVVPGLYAAGVVCEWNTSAGATVLCAMTAGRIAGQNAAMNESLA